MSIIGLTKDLVTPFGFLNYEESSILYKERAYELKVGHTS